ncbi:hypothetical protein ABIB39_002691 [Mucilaginibacter sp. UYP27]
MRHSERSVAIFGGKAGEEPIEDCRVAIAPLNDCFIIPVSIRLSSQSLNFCKQNVIKLVN